MDTTYEISNLVKKSLKRHAVLQKTRKDISLDYPGFRVLHLTRWAVRAESMNSILDNWVVFQQVRDKSVDRNLEPDIKGWIIGVKGQMNAFNNFYGVIVLQLVLTHSDNLSKTLQKPPLTSFQGKESADLTLKTINTLRWESEFEILWQKTAQQAAVLEITQPSLPLKRKRPATLINESEAPLYDEISDVRSFYRCI